MRKSETDEDVLDTVKNWLLEAFPDRICPKCGHSKFFILDPTGQALNPGPLTFDAWPITKIACSRCGFMEEHLTGVLRKSLEENGHRPFERLSSDG